MACEECREKFLSSPTVNLGPVWVSLKPLRVNLGPLEINLRLASHHVTPDQGSSVEGELKALGV